MELFEYGSNLDLKSLSMIYHSKQSNDYLRYPIFRGKPDYARLSNFSPRGFFLHKKENNKGFSFLLKK